MSVTATNSSRRPMGYFGPFNLWWSEFFTKNHRRPSKTDIETWRSDNPDWRPELTLEEILQHSKGRRDPEKNRQYFCEYRRRRRVSARRSTVTAKRARGGRRAAARRQRAAGEPWEEPSSGDDDRGDDGGVGSSHDDGDDREQEAEGQEVGTDGDGAAQTSSALRRPWRQLARCRRGRLPPQEGVCGGQGGDGALIGPNGTAADPAAASHLHADTSEPSTSEPAAAASPSDPAVIAHCAASRAPEPVLKEASPPPPAAAMPASGSGCHADLVLVPVRRAWGPMATKQLRDAAMRTREQHQHNSAPPGSLGAPGSSGSGGNVGHHCASRTPAEAAGPAAAAAAGNVCCAMTKATLPWCDAAANTLPLSSPSGLAVPLGLPAFHTNVPHASLPLVPAVGLPSSQLTGSWNPVPASGPAGSLNLPYWVNGNGALWYRASTAAATWVPPCAPLGGTAPDSYTLCTRAASAMSQPRVVHALQPPDAAVLAGSVAGRASVGSGAACSPIAGAMSTSLVNCGAGLRRTYSAVSISNCRGPGGAPGVGASAAASTQDQLPLEPFGAQVAALAAAMGAQMGAAAAAASAAACAAAAAAAAAAAGTIAPAKRACPMSFGSNSGPFPVCCASEDSCGPPASEPAAGATSLHRGSAPSSAAKCQRVAPGGGGIQCDVPERDAAPRAAPKYDTIVSPLSRPTGQHPRPPAQGACPYLTSPRVLCGSSGAFPGWGAAQPLHSTSTSPGGAAKFSSSCFSLESHGAVTAAPAEAGPMSAAPLRHVASCTAGASMDLDYAAAVPPPLATQPPPQQQQPSAGPHVEPFGGDWEPEGDALDPGWLDSFLADPGTLGLLDSPRAIAGVLGQPGGGPPSADALGFQGIGSGCNAAAWDALMAQGLW